MQACVVPFHGIELSIRTIPFQDLQGSRNIRRRDGDHVPAAVAVPDLDASRMRTAHFNDSPDVDIEDATPSLLDRITHSDAGPIERIACQGRNHDEVEPDEEQDPDHQPTPLRHCQYHQEHDDEREHHAQMDCGTCPTSQSDDVGHG